MIQFSNKQNIPYIISKEDKLDESFYGNIKHFSKKGFDMLTIKGKSLGIKRTEIFKQMKILMEEELLDSIE